MLRSPRIEAISRELWPCVFDARIRSPTTALFPHTCTGRWKAFHERGAQRIFPEIWWEWDLLFAVWIAEQPSLKRHAISPPPAC